MPGLRSPWQTTAAPYGNYSFLQDAQTPSVKESSWDHPVDLKYDHLPPVDHAMPFVGPGVAHRAALPPPQSHADWMRGLAGSASNAFSGPGISPSPPQSKESSDLDDLFQVDDISCLGSPSPRDASDADSGPPKICNSLQALTSSYGGVELELLTAVRKLVLAIDVADLVCNAEGIDCRGGCIKRLVASHLRGSGYNAAVCKSKWEGSSNVLQGPIQMGEYEYIDVEVRCNGFVERLIVDLDFQDQFVLARATPTHLSVVELLPTVFVGTTARLEQILRIVSESVRASLKHNCMPIPPWRTLSFYHSKWLAAHERVEEKPSPCSPRALRPSSLCLKGRLPSMPEMRQCDVQLRRVIDSVLTEVNGSTLNVLGRGRAW